MTIINTQFLLLSTILKTRLDEVYPDIFIALRIMLHCPDAAVSPERSFSKLKLIKTFNRSHMTSSRLSSLAILSIEASCVRSLDLDDVINPFACQTACAKLFWCYYHVTLFMIFTCLLWCNTFHACYCATIQWFLLFCCMPTVYLLDSPAFSGVGELGCYGTVHTYLQLFGV